MDDEMDDDEERRNGGLDWAGTGSIYIHIDARHAKGEVAGGILSRSRSLRFHSLHLLRKASVVFLDRLISIRLIAYFSIFILLSRTPPGIIYMSVCRAWVCVCVCVCIGAPEGDGKKSHR